MTKRNIAREAALLDNFPAVDQLDRPRANHTR